MMQTSFLLLCVLTCQSGCVHGYGGALAGWDNCFLEVKASFSVRELITA